MTTATPLWTPSPDRVAAANVTAFREAAAARFGVPLPDWAALWRWSTEHRDQFWEAVWDDAGVIASKRWDAVLENDDAFPGATWFGGARLNYAENLLRRRDDAVAIISWTERGDRRRLTFAELAREVARVAKALRGEGVGQGDRVAAYLPNLPETVVAGLAAFSIGAVWSSCSPDFGTGAVVDRFGQIEPKVLLTTDAYTWGGKRFDVLPKVREVLGSIPSVARTVIVPYAGEGAPDLTGLAGPVLWDDWAAGGDGAELAFEQLPFDHPLYVLYSSGTTGKPKAITHGAGGSLLQHLKEHRLHSDVKRDDHVFYFTTCGWMMWNWLITGLAAEAAIVLWDGSPFHPEPKVLWDMAEQERLTHFGTAARYIAAIEKEGLKPRESHDLAALRAVMSTGSPLAPESFDYVYRDLKSDLQLASISGGTDIVSCFALGNPVGPVWRGELQTRGLGMDVEVFDDDAAPIRGEPGELVCRKPFPSAPIYFWNDEDGARYRAAYFERFPGVWRHGDWCELTEHDGMIIYGRSDAVLNPGGVRIGTAEIYRLLEQMDEIADAVVVGQDWEGDVRVVLFVKMPEGKILDDELRAAIRKRIRSAASPRHVPAVIVQCPDVPRTINNKISELAVRNVLHGREVRNRDALANPEVLSFFEDVEELRG